jgi:hypothetical protein
LIRRLKEFSPGRLKAQVSEQHRIEMETLNAKLEEE